MSSLGVLLVALLMLFPAMNLKRECPYKTNATTHENTDSALSHPWPHVRTNRTGETLSGCGSRWLVLGTRFQVENNNMSPCMAHPLIICLWRRVPSWLVFERFRRIYSPIDSPTFQANTTEFLTVVRTIFVMYLTTFLASHPISPWS